MKAEKNTYHFSVVIEKDTHGNYVGIVPALRSCYTQAKTLPALYERLQEVVALSMDVEQSLFKKDIPQSAFIGVHQLEFKT